MRIFVWAALAAVGVWASVGVSSANDTVRLGGPSAQSAIEDDSDTDLVHGRYYGGGYGRGYGGGRGYGYGGGRGYGYGGGRGYGYGGGYGHGRSYYGGHHGQSYYGGHHGQSYYGGYYGQSYSYYPSSYGYYSSSYYYPQSYYYSPSYYYPSACYNYPIAGASVQAPATTLQGNYQTPQYVPPMPPPTGNGPFQYDGGPQSPVPLPKPNASPPKGSIPTDGKLVVLPTEQNTTTPRVSYPAYGEEPIAPAPRKANR